jgi:anti-sigma regulatory factor (Ser/Thr protein kinase)
MKELSLHVLDIAENSTRAGASFIEISITEESDSDTLEIVISDNGMGMDAGMVKQAINPFFTTKDVRRVGIGLSIFRQAALLAGGEFHLESSPDEGTCVTARFVRRHIDRQPLGDMASTITTILLSNPDVDICYIHEVDGDKFIFDTRVVRTILSDGSISDPEVIKFLVEVIRNRQNLE